MLELSASMPEVIESRELVELICRLLLMLIVVVCPSLEVGDGSVIESEVLTLESVLCRAIGVDIMPVVPSTSELVICVGAVTEVMLVVWSTVPLYTSAVEVGTETSLELLSACVVMEDCKLLEVSEIRSAVVKLVILGVSMLSG